MENLVLTARSEQNGSAFVWLTWSTGTPQDADGFSETTSFLCDPYVFNALYHHSITPLLHYSMSN
jgi:hypothetical protein